MKTLAPFLALTATLGWLVIKEVPRSTHQHPQSVPRIAEQERAARIAESDDQTQTWALGEIESRNAWKISSGNHKVVIAIIDTGADIHHPDLEANIWMNPGETGTDAEGHDKATNGVDDDGNGFIDDVHGWNFAGWNNDVTDNHGHGTHIAGIIGARGDNDYGISGVAPEVSLMILKYYDPSSAGSDSVLREVAAIKYAVAMGANIINFSAGGPQQSADEEDAIREAGEKGVLFVAAAGNERANSDIKGFYPADYPLSNILSVTAIDSSRRVLASSNYGERTVDIAAPGRDIESTLPEGRYGRMSGTSQATAFATGVAALLLASRMDAQAREPLTETKAGHSSLAQAWTPETLIEQIVRSGEPDGLLTGKTRARTRLNSYRALALKE